ncbi:cytochrome P450 [Lentzea kentuckyensis]|uniref:cytochrome P450 n=1 Tax=Lentzea kentuckyensis TaxID=360086 RepID=UPI000A3C780B|nr:cytochrome P450 [Lentzea kentuckyensis]
MTSAPLAMRRDVTQPLNPAPELLSADAAGGITEIAMPMTTPGAGRTWLVTNAEEIRRVLGDPETFSNVLRLPSGGPGGDASPTGPGSLLGLDPPEHTRLRGLLTSEFSARRIAGLRPAIEQIAQSVLSRFRDDDRADLVAQFAQPVPAIVIAELLGVPSTDRDEFCRRSGIAIDTRLAPLARAHNRAEMQSYMGDLVRGLRRAPGKGLLGDLVRRHGAELTDAELVAMGNLLLLAGHETTSSLIGQSILLLLERPSDRQVMLRDQKSAARGVEDLLRFLTVFHFSLPRTVRRDVVIAGTAVSSGDRVLCSFPVANRDPHRYQPVEFVPSRAPAPHLAFGHGIHYCLGAPLARLEMQIVLPALFAAFPEIRLDVQDGVTFRDGSLTFGLETLPVALR